MHYKPGLTSEVAFIEDMKRILKDCKADGISLLAGDPYSLGLYGYLEDVGDVYNMWNLIQ